MKKTMLDEYIRKELNKNNLPIFDANATCRKCGSKDISAHYEKTSEVMCKSEQYLPYGTYIHGEHIDRYCRFCHYVWAEAPIDTEREERKVYGYP